MLDEVRTVKSVLIFVLPWIELKPVVLFCMDIDPRLEEIDDSLYRGFVRALIVSDNKMLAVKSKMELVGYPRWWRKLWRVPGSMSLTWGLVRDYGVPSSSVSSDFQIVHYNDPEKSCERRAEEWMYFSKYQCLGRCYKETDHVEKWGWFTKDEFMELKKLNPSYDKMGTSKIILVWHIQLGCIKSSLIAVITSSIVVTREHKHYERDFFGSLLFLIYNEAKWGFPLKVIINWFKEAISWTLQRNISGRASPLVF